VSDTASERYLFATRGTEPPSEGPAYYALGLAGETGELIELVKKFVYHGRDADFDKVLREAGDVMWYLTRLLSCYGWTVEDAMDNNVEKMRLRYPDGYSHEASAARADERR